MVKMVTEEDDSDARFEGEYEPVIGNPDFQPEKLAAGFQVGVPTGLTRSQCGGSWDAQDVERYDGTLGVSKDFVDTHETPVGQLRWRSDIARRYRNPGNIAGQRWCTGTMISDDVMITAGHCFPTGDSGGWRMPRNNNGSPVPIEELALEMTVEFNYQRAPDGSFRPTTAYPVVELMERQNSRGIDYAVARLGPTDGKLPGAVHGYTKVSDVDAVIGDMCCIIGHPQGRPKAIEAGTADRFTRVRMQYGDIDTLGGNSGSGILRRDTNDIVGVHTNGGCTTTGGFNSGMRISAIIQRSPAVRAILAARRSTV